MNDSLIDLWAKHESYVYSLKALDHNDPKFDNLLIHFLLQLRKINLFIVERLRVQWDRESSSFHQHWEPRLSELATCLNWMTSSKRKKFMKAVRLNVKLNPFVSRTRINGKTAFLNKTNKHLPSSLKSNPCPLPLRMNDQQEELCTSLGKFLYLIYKGFQPRTMTTSSTTETAQVIGHYDDIVANPPSQKALELVGCLRQWKFKIHQLRRYRCLQWSVNRRIARDVSPLNLIDRIDSPDISYSYS